MSTEHNRPRSARSVVIIGVLLFALEIALIARAFSAEPDTNAIFADGFETPCVVNCDPPLPDVTDYDLCADPSTGLNLDGIRPFGWTPYQLTWLQAFSAPACLTNPRDRRCSFATYPNSLGVPVPLGTWRGGYLSVPFTTLPRLTVDMSWDTAQANGNIGYGTPRPADAMWIAISPCAGDMRPPDSTPNPWTKPGCRVLAGGASLFYRTFGAPGEAFCRLKPNALYYLTVSPSNPLDVLTLGEHTCSETAVNSALRCDVQTRHTGVQNLNEHDSIKWMETQAKKNRLERERRRKAAEDFR